MRICMLHFATSSQHQGGTGLPALSPTPVSGEMRDNSLYESLQGLGVQEPEYEMRHPYSMKALQLADHFCAASGHEVLLRAAHHLIGVFGDACCTQIRQFDLRRVPAHANAMAFQNGHLASVLFNRARIEIPPVRPASYYRQRLLFTPAPNK